MFAVQYATQAIHPVIGRDLDHGPAITGLTISVVIAGVALGSWLLGPLSDRIGRRRVMVGSCLLLVIPSALIAVAPAITIARASRPDATPPVPMIGRSTALYSS